MPEKLIPHLTLISGRKQGSYERLDNAQNEEVVNPIKSTEFVWASVGTISLFYAVKEFSRGHLAQGSAAAIFSVFCAISTSEALIKRWENPKISPPKHLRLVS